MEIKMLFFLLKAKLHDKQITNMNMLLYIRFQSDLQT